MRTQMRFLGTISSMHQCPPSNFAVLIDGMILDRGRKCVFDRRVAETLLYANCRRGDSNSHGARTPADFESAASTNFATPAVERECNSRAAL